MFVCSSHKSLDLRGRDRLYAYPNVPQIDNNLIILDSGAFGLSMAARKMDDAHIKCLLAFYELHGHQENTHCIAPDEFKNPIASMARYDNFRREASPSLSISPVIQFARRGFVDLFSAKKQIRFYSNIDKPKMICISNHAFNAISKQSDLCALVDIVREKFGDILIHVLGAGFNSIDVAQWMKTGINSMDSISYYTDAKNHQKWIFGSSALEPSDLPFSELALINADIANKSAKFSGVIL